MGVASVHQLEIRTSVGKPFPGLTRIAIRKHNRPTVPSPRRSMAEGGGGTIPSPNIKVKFVDGEFDKTTVVKQVPTQKYNRKEIQKRLDIENWMDEQLRDLYESEEYPQLDIDDVHKIEVDEREEKLKAYLSESKKPIDDFVEELMTKAADIKPVSAS